MWGRGWRDRHSCAGWRMSYDVDVMASVRATWQVAPWMAAQGSGVVIHIASTSGLEAGSPLGLRDVAQVITVERQEIPGNEARGRICSEHRDA